MGKINTHKLGLTLGIFAGVVHLIWAVLVWLNWAEGFASWVRSIHFITSPMSLSPFDSGQAVLLILIASFVGYVFGRLLGTIWNKVN